MNINNLYPTDATIPVGSTAGQFTDKLTARIPSLSPLTQESYWLGYISYDNLPLIMQHSKLYYSDDDTVTIANNTVVDNYPCGYIDGVIRCGIYMVDDVYVSNQYYQYIRFLNDLHPEYTAAYLNANTSPMLATSIYFLYYITIDGEVTAKDILSQMPGFSINFNNTENDGLVGMMEFMQGQRTITITLGQHTFDITIEGDLYETGHAEIVSNEDTDTVMNLFINTINLPDRGLINGTIGYTSYSAFAVKVKYEEEGETHSYNVVLHNIENQLRPLILYVKYQYGLVTNFTYTDEGNTHGLFYSTGAAGEFSATALDALDAATGYIYSGNLVAFSAYGSGGINKRAYIAMIMPGKDLYKIFSLYMPRVDVSSNATVVQISYINNVTYATDVSSDNEFLARLKTGNIADDVFRDGLRYWQYSSITNNDFTEDDIPEYNPNPDDDDTDSGGDDILPYDWTNLVIGATNNFVTLYGMTAATVADFGRQMWASLADPAFWQMVGTAFTNDFSINPADMMKYFISLRYFPFDLADFAHSVASGIYIGRAATPIAPSIGVAYPIRITNNVVQVDGGRLTIRRYYNDFRDYEPCTTVQIHVPFCGSVDVPASEVMGHQMDLTYKIDLQTGAMLAVLGVASNTYYVIATLAGTCGASIPITANNNIEFLQRIATVGTGLIGGGSSGAVKGATVGGEVGAVVGAVAGTVGGAGALAGLPPVTVHKQGNASGFANLGGVPYAYATVQRGRFERPDNYGHTSGFACDFSASLGSLSGFTVCYNVDTSGLTCNARERDEIKRLLESGVYV